MTPRQRLIIVTEEAFEPTIADLSSQGWQVRSGWALPREPFALTSHRVACAGSVTSEREAADALLCAVRGASIVARLDPDSPSCRSFMPDLCRVGEVELRGHDLPATNALAPDEAHLLRLLADGRSLAEAAASLHMSVRTANRRLARAKEALGVDTTAEALMQFLGG